MAQKYRVFLESSTQSCAIFSERRKGCGWFKDSAKRVAQHYAKWAKLHPLK